MRKWRILMVVCHKRRDDGMCAKIIMIGPGRHPCIYLIAANSCSLAFPTSHCPRSRYGGSWGSTPRWWSQQTPESALQLFHKTITIHQKEVPTITKHLDRPINDSHIRLLDRLCSQSRLLCALSLGLCHSRKS